jgi:hypothetical protein
VNGFLARVQAHADIQAIGQLHDGLDIDEKSPGSPHKNSQYWPLAASL